MLQVARAGQSKGWGKTGAPRKSPEKKDRLAKAKVEARDSVKALMVNEGLTRVQAQWQVCEDQQRKLAAEGLPFSTKTLKRQFF